MWLRLLAEHFLRESVMREVRRQVTTAARSAASEPSSTTGDPEKSESSVPQLPVEGLILFALSAESGALVDRMSQVTRTRCESFFEYDGLLEIVEDQAARRVVVIDTGVGLQAARLATEDALALHKPRWVISAGFAGGLAEPLRRGHFLLASEIACDVATIDGVVEAIELRWKFDLATMGSSVTLGRLVTVGKLICKEKEKRAIGERTGGLACDMESHAVAEVCRKHGAKLLSIRIISDAVEDELPPEIEKLLSQKTMAAKLGAAAGAVLGRLSAAKDMWQLHQDSIRASQRMAKFIVAMAQGLMTQ